MVIKHPLDPESIHLLKSSHTANKEQQWCVMEAAAYIAGERWSDHPKCVSPAITKFAIGLNDGWDDDQPARQTRKRANGCSAIGSRGSMRLRGSTSLTHARGTRRRCARSLK